MTIHVRDAGVWKDVDEIHARDAGVWKKVTEGHVKDSGAWKKFYSAETVALSNNSVFAAAPSPGTALSVIRFRTDGQLQKVINGAPINVIGEWFDPVGSPSGYRVRAILSSGVTPSGPALNTWHALSTQRDWSISRSTVGTTSSTLSISIDDGSGTPIVTASILLIAEVFA